MIQDVLTDLIGQVVFGLAVCYQKRFWHFGAPREPILMIIICPYLHLVVATS